MKVIPIEYNFNKAGVPNYYDIYCKWLSHWRQTGSKHSLNNAKHYAKVAEEFNQAIIVQIT